MEMVSLFSDPMIFKNGIKIAVFWVVGPCSLLVVYQRFRDVYNCPDEGGSKYLGNEGTLLPNCKALQSRKTVIFILTFAKNIKSYIFKNI
jgi:hypothetical protein